jgi:pre-mRNA cleavage complex 2 protein Pcf11
LNTILLEVSKQFYLILYCLFLVEDPRERRPSICSSIGEDTDMRQLFVDPDAADDGESNPMNINIIISQADEQLNNGTISISQYNTLLKQVIFILELSYFINFST